MPRPNRPHYHVFLEAAGERIFYKARRLAFGSRQAAREWAMRRQPDPTRRLVLQCYREHCKPPLD